MPITIQNQALRLKVRPDLGAGIADFSFADAQGRWVPLMRRAEAGEVKASNLACFIMAPWCNRIAGAAFTFGGHAHQLRPAPPATPGTPPVAQHGDVRARAWAILDRSPTSARLIFQSRRATEPPVNFPFAFTTTVRYELHADRLVVDLSVANDGEEPMPAACGLHPYFMRHLLSERDDVTLRAPCTGRYPTRDGLPTGPPVADALVQRLAEDAPLPSAHTDALLAGFGGEARLRWPQSGVALTIAASANLGHLVLFAPHAPPAAGAAPGPLPYFAVEPQSAATDAFNMLAAGREGSGAVVLDPGRSLDAWCTFTLERYGERPGAPS